MDNLEKAVEWCIYLVIGVSIFGLAMGMFRLIDLFFIRGCVW